LKLTSDRRNIARPVCLWSSPALIGFHQDMHRSHAQTDLAPKGLSWYLRQDIRCSQFRGLKNWVG